ncbi:MAG: nucleotidyltransferase family protein [Clostridia bacterium]|nr:nucleotidyltransferase family protein [Clostridia bacterium]
MRVAGIIAEYNPLHNGHIYHLEQAKALTGAEYCIVVMSGNFVQRGEAACTDKFTRAEWALKVGADLVLELPSVYALSNAERFAMGGVRTLRSTGVVTDLAFGCEAKDVTMLYQLSDIITSEPPLFREALKRRLAEGKSYPRARFEALMDYGVPDHLLEAVTQPNNILALEYLRALSVGGGIRPLPVTRIGTDYHSEDISGRYASATAIRKALAEGRREILETMPSFIGGPLMFDEQFVIPQEALGDMTLYALRKMSLEALRAIPDVGEGFENLIYRAARSVSDIQAFFEAVKSKRYTLARCKRIAACALLGITLDQIYATVKSPDSCYLRVLGLQKRARPLLSEIARNARGTLILRNADIQEAPLIVQRNLETDMLSTDILAYATGHDIRRDLSGPIIL